MSAKSGKHLDVPEEHQQWCVIHQRKATKFFVREEREDCILGEFCCDPKLGGIMLPCSTVPLSKK